MGRERVHNKNIILDVIPDYNSNAHHHYPPLQNRIAAIVQLGNRDSVAQDSDSIVPVSRFALPRIDAPDPL